MDEEEKTMAEYSIRNLSEMFDLPASTLRYYEELGLLADVKRTPSGQRVYEQKHINRLKTICCFKNTGMTMAQLQTFFSYESNEPEHIDDILALLNDQKLHVLEQLEQLQKDYKHVLRKLHYYGDIKISLQAGQPLPVWADYREKIFEE